VIYTAVRQWKATTTWRCLAGTFKPCAGQIEQLWLRGRHQSLPGQCLRTSCSTRVVLEPSGWPGKLLMTAAAIPRQGGLEQDIAVGRMVDELCWQRPVDAVSKQKESSAKTSTFGHSLPRGIFALLRRAERGRPDCRINGDARLWRGAEKLLEKFQSPRRPTPLRYGLRAEGALPWSSMRTAVLPGPKAEFEQMYFTPFYRRRGEPPTARARALGCPWGGSRSRDATAATPVARHGKTAAAGLIRWPRV